MSKELWHMKDLITRWGLPERQVREIVLTQGVPRVELRRPPKNIDWGAMRFRPEAVEAWERSREVVSKPSAPAAVPPVVPRRPQKRHPLLGI